MCDIDRRDFIRMGSAGAAGLGLTGAAVSSSAGVLEANRPVFFQGDGLNLGPGEYADTLAGIVATGDLEEDYYSNGGIVEELENKMAAILGKEKAVFLPTGTLANHLGLRLLCESKRGTRVVTQAESHVSNDVGDNSEVLASIRVFGLRPGEVDFTLEDVQAEHTRAKAGRVKTGIGAISIESPVRRKLGGVFDFEELQRISAWAESEGIGRHLDGARLFMGAAYSGIPVDRWAGLFDTVYVSLWKYFNAGSGAILAGPADLLDGLFHTRLMYGGSLIRGWVYAVVALHFLVGFEERFQRGIEVSEDLFGRLDRNQAFRLRRIPNGSNVFVLDVQGVDPKAFRLRMGAAGVSMREPRPDGSIIVQVNETWASQTGEELARRMIAALD